MCSSDLNPIFAVNCAIKVTPIERVAVTGIFTALSSKKSLKPTMKVDRISIIAVSHTTFVFVPTVPRVLKLRDSLI